MWGWCDGKWEKQIVYYFEKAKPVPNNKPLAYVMSNLQNINYIISIKIIEVIMF